MLCSWTITWYSFAMGIILPSMSDDLGLGSAAQGWLSASFFLGSFIFMVPLTNVFSRFPPVHTMSAVLVVTSALLFAAAAVPAYPAQLGIRFVIAVVFVAANPIRTLLTQERFRAEEYALANGVTESTFGITEPIAFWLTAPLLTLFGGWQVNGIYRWTSGFPIALYLTNGQSVPTYGGQRPNLTATLERNPNWEQNLNQYFANPQAVTTPAPYMIGTAPRTLSNVRLPGTNVTSASLFKQFNLSALRELALRRTAKEVQDQLEAYMIRYACIEGALAGDGKLLFRQSNAGDVDATFPVQIQRHTAPAATDIQHLHTGFQSELGGDVRLLVLLRLVEILMDAIPVGAAILAVLVQKQIVERARKIIMMRDIRLGGGAEVDLAQAAGGLLDHRSERPNPIETAVFLPRRIAASEGNKAHDVVIIDRGTPIHIGFRETEAWVQHDVAPDFIVLEAQGDIGEAGGWRAECPARSIGANQRQCAML